MGKGGYIVCGTTAVTGYEMEFSDGSQYHVVQIFYHIYYIPLIPSKGGLEKHPYGDFEKGGVRIIPYPRGAPDVTCTLMALGMLRVMIIGACWVGIYQGFIGNPAGYWVAGAAAVVGCALLAYSPKASPQLTQAIADHLGVRPAAPARSPSTTPSHTTGQTFEVAVSSSLTETLSTPTFAHEMRDSPAATVQAQNPIAKAPPPPTMQEHLANLNLPPEYATALADLGVTDVSHCVDVSVEDVSHIMKPMEARRFVRTAAEMAV